MRPIGNTSFSPRRALLHPLWLGSLALLALNDHVLKGSGLLPGVVTGKLSDFAGLLVAPLLFATLLFVRGRVGWIFAHVSVGVVFSGIQLSRAFADLWSDAMGLVGFPWVITSDPTDLLALPMLLVSYFVYPRVAAKSVRANVRRSIEAGAATGGLFACIATSPPPSEVDWEIEADVYFHNDNDFDAVVRIRRLSPVAIVDCNQVEEDPGRYLSEPMFGDVESWTVWPDANLALAETTAPARECEAVLLEADSVEPKIVFWRPGNPAWGFVQGEGIDPDAPGFVSLKYDGDGRGTYEAGMDILFDAVPPSARVEGVCAPQSEAERVVWSDDVPSGVWFLGAVEPGVDGCVGLDLRTGFQQQQELEGRNWYLCLPSGAFPFDVGQRIEILPDYGSGLAIRELEAETNAATGLELVVSRGSGVADVFGMQATFVPTFECELSVEPTCGTLARPGTLTVVGGGFNAVEVGLGQTATTSRTDGTQVDIWLGHAEERFALRTDCASGPDELGIDIELVAVQRAGGE